MPPYTRLQKKIDDSKASEANSFLMDAARHGDVASADATIFYGVDLECRDEGGDGDTPLMIASDNGHLDIVKLLVERGADVNARDFCGDTALAYAARKDHNKIVKYLIEAGADAQTQNKYKFTPLDYAVRTLNLESQKYLIRAGGERGVRLSTYCELESLSELAPSFC